MSMHQVALLQDLRQIVHSEYEHMSVLVQKKMQEGRGAR